MFRSVGCQVARNAQGLKRGIFNRSGSGNAGTHITFDEAELHCIGLTSHLNANLVACGVPSNLNTIP